jgi:hypothetical protein
MAPAPAAAGSHRKGRRKAHSSSSASDNRDAQPRTNAICGRPTIAPAPKNLPAN